MKLWPGRRASGFGANTNIKREEERRRTIFTRRAAFLGAVQLGALGFLGHRLYRLQIEEGRRYATLAEENRVSARLFAPPRGRILDRRGEVVAGNRLNWRALLVAEQTADVTATIETFSRIVPLQDHEKARIERDIRRNRRFVPVILREFLSWEEMAAIEVNAPDLPGVSVDMGTTRIYPETEHLAHVLGYVGTPTEQEAGDEGIVNLPGMRVGRAGLERFHEMCKSRSMPGCKRPFVTRLMKAPRQYCLMRAMAKCSPWQPSLHSIPISSIPASAPHNGGNGTHRVQHH